MAPSSGDDAAMAAAAAAAAAGASADAASPDGGAAPCDSARVAAASAAFVREVMRVTQDPELALGALHAARREVRAPGGRRAHLGCARARARER
jgi:threonine synthase